MAYVVCVRWLQFGMFETVLSALFDRYPFLRAKKICVTAVISVTEFLLGLLLVCNVSERRLLSIHCAFVSK